MTISISRNTNTDPSLFVKSQSFAKAGPVKITDILSKASCTNTQPKKCWIRACLESVWNWILKHIFCRDKVEKPLLNDAPSTSEPLQSHKADKRTSRFQKALPLDPWWEKSPIQSSPINIDKAKSFSSFILTKAYNEYFENNEFLDAANAAKKITLQGDSLIIDRVDGSQKVSILRPGEGQSLLHLIMQRRFEERTSLVKRMIENILPFNKEKALEHANTLLKKIFFEQLKDNIQYLDVTSPLKEITLGEDRIVFKLEDKKWRFFQLKPHQKENLLDFIVKKQNQKACKLVKEIVQDFFANERLKNKASCYLTELYQKQIDKMDNPRPALKLVNKVAISGDLLILKRSDGEANHRLLKEGEGRIVLNYISCEKAEGREKYLNKIIQDALLFPAHMASDLRWARPADKDEMLFSILSEENLDPFIQCNGELVIIEGAVHRVVGAFRVNEQENGIIYSLQGVPVDEEIPNEDEVLPATKFFQAKLKKAWDAASQGILKADPKFAPASDGCTELSIMPNFGTDDPLVKFFAKQQMSRLGKKLNKMIENSEFTI